MSFRVFATAPMGDGWDERDRLITRAAGRKSDWVMRDKYQCVHEWAVAAFEDARRMKARLAQVEGVQATFREAM